jgi:hypothetical protein
MLKEGRIRQVCPSIHPQNPKNFNIYKIYTQLIHTSIPKICTTISLYYAQPNSESKHVQTRKRKPLTRIPGLPPPIKKVLLPIHLFANIYVYTQLKFSEKNETHQSIKAILKGVRSQKAR